MHTIFVYVFSFSVAFFKPQAMSSVLGDGDILLMAQLLHSKNIADTEKLSETSDEELGIILDQWKLHPSTKLSNTSIPVETPEEFRQLYRDTLKEKEVNNTVELANKTYFSRIKQLELLIDGYKTEFKQVLQS